MRLLLVKFIIGSTVTALAPFMGCDRALASDGFTTADILGAHLGMPLDVAAKAIVEALSSNSSGEKASVNIFSGQLNDGPISTPTILFGAHVQGALDQVDITNSARPGIGVIAISRRVSFYSVPEPTDHDFEQRIIGKYGQPIQSYSEFGAKVLWWTANSQVKPKNGRNRASAFCTQALEIPDGNQVQNRMARGNYAIPPFQEQSSCGTWMAVSIIPDQSNKALINSFSIGIINFAGLWESYSYTSAELQRRKAKKDADDTETGAHVEPKL